MPLPLSFWAREDSGSANNPALNLTGDPAVQLTFVAETNTGGGGDLILEQNGGLPDPDTQVEIDGVSYEFTFELSGTMPTAKPNGAQQVPDQFEGEIVYIITVQDYPTAGETTRYAFMPNAGATEAEMNDFGNGAIDVQAATTTPPPAPICFLKGTLIAVSTSQVAVETLKVGDVVQTADGKSMPVIWIGQSRHVWPGAHEGGKPILISQGALGGGLPTSDLAVSPQHKMVLNDPKTSEACLVPAKVLVDWPGIRQMQGKKSAVYFHVMLAKHSILVANGSPSESFYPGPVALASLDGAQRNAVLDLVPALRNDPHNGYGPFVYKALSVTEALQKFGATPALSGTNAA